MWGYIICPWKSLHTTTSTLLSKSTVKRFWELYLVHFRQLASTTTIRTGLIDRPQQAIVLFSTTAPNSTASSPLRRPPSLPVPEPTQLPPHDLKLPISHPPP